MSWGAKRLIGGLGSLHVVARARQSILGLGLEGTPELVVSLEVGFVERRESLPLHARGRSVRCHVGSDSGTIKSLTAHSFVPLSLFSLPTLNLVVSSSICGHAKTDSGGSPPSPLHRCRPRSIVYKQEHLQPRCLWPSVARQWLKAYTYLQHLFFTTDLTIMSSRRLVHDMHDRSAMVMATN
jgi:hypothetical protein